MKFHLKNVGLIEDATLELADLTILCGENNTGKTYVTYAVYGFLRNWRDWVRQVVRHDLHKDTIQLVENQVDFANFSTEKTNAILHRAADLYAKNLPAVFSSNPDLFSGATFSLSVNGNKRNDGQEYRRILKGAGNEAVATLLKEKGSSILQVLVANNAFPLHSLMDFMADAVCEIVFAPHLSQVFIASAERTGAAIFRKELDFARSGMLEIISQKDEKALRNPFHLARQLQAKYAMPVRDNVDFVRQLEDIDKEESPLLKAHPELQDAFDAVIGGTYKVVKDKGVQYQPKGARGLRLSMSESSSSVRAMLDIGFYLRCRAKAGDLLMIDEPELNLHPVNQRAFARLIAQLVNAGVKVFMTTHSDYIIKELNTLIMLHGAGERAATLRKTHGYSPEERLSAQRVKLYMTGTTSGRRENGKRNVKIQGLKEAKIDSKLGIEVETFDKTIEEMNAMQEEILYGGEL